MPLSLVWHHWFISDLASLPRLDKLSSAGFSVSEQPLNSHTFVPLQATSLILTPFLTVYCHNYYRPSSEFSELQWVAGYTFHCSTNMASEIKILCTFSWKSFEINKKRGKKLRISTWTLNVPRMNLNFGSSFSTSWVENYKSMSPHPVSCWLGKHSTQWAATWLTSCKEDYRKGDSTCINIKITFKSYF